MQAKLEDFFSTLQEEMREYGYNGKPFQKGSVATSRPSSSSEVPSLNLRVTLKKSKSSNGLLSARSKKPLLQKKKDSDK